MESKQFLFHVLENVIRVLKMPSKQQIIRKDLLKLTRTEKKSKNLIHSPAPILSFKKKSVNVPTVTSKKKSVNVPTPITLKLELMMENIPIMRIMMMLTCSIQTCLNFDIDINEICFIKI